jgi:four helix bundle protein
MGSHAAGQLARSGTSPAPNYEEACAAESRADFVHKLGIVLKELREVRFWLRFSVRAELLGADHLTDLIDECAQLCDIIGKSVVTAKKNRSVHGIAP